MLYFLSITWPLLVIWLVTGLGFCLAIFGAPESNKVLEKSSDLVKTLLFLFILVGGWIWIPIVMIQDRIRENRLHKEIMRELSLFKKYKR